MFWSSFLGTLAAFYVITWCLMVSFAYSEYLENKKDAPWPHDILACILLGPLALLAFLPDMLRTLAHRVKELLER